MTTFVIQFSAETKSITITKKFTSTRSHMERDDKAHCTETLWLDYFDQLELIETDRKFLKASVYQKMWNVV